MTYTIVVCTVKNSWWWTEELSETYRVSFQNYFEKLVHLVGFIIRNDVTKWGTSVPCARPHLLLINSVLNFHCHNNYEFSCILKIWLHMLSGLFFLQWDISNFTSVPCAEYM
jgi:hypothetical protein